MAHRPTVEEAVKIYSPLVEENAAAIPVLLIGFRDGTTSQIDLTGFGTVQKSIRTLTERVKTGLVMEVQWALFSSEASVAVADASGKLSSGPAALTRDTSAFAMARHGGKRVTDAIVISMVDRTEGLVYSAWKPFVRSEVGIVTWQHLIHLGPMDPDSDPVVGLLAKLVAADLHQEKP